MSGSFAGSGTRTMESPEREIETRLAAAPYEDRIQAIAEKHGVDASKIREQLRIGIEVEKEHGGGPEQQAKTALDHLDEKADYYDKLKEAGLKKLAGTETAWTHGETSSGGHVNAESKAFAEQDALDQLDQKEQIRSAFPTPIDEQIAKGPKHIANEKGLEAEIQRRMKKNQSKKPGARS
jgi:hypothetical protein